MRVMKRFVAGSTVVMMFVLAGAAPAMAAESLSISDGTLGKGQIVTLRGTGCVANTNVVARLDALSLNRRLSDAEGDFLLSVRIPFTVALGTHRLGIRCLRAYPVGSVLVLNKTIRVHGGITVTPTTSPRRGTSVTVSGRGCRPFQTVTFKLGTMKLLARPAGSTGAFSRTMRIPFSAPLGLTLMRAICGSLEQAELVRIRS